VDVFDLNGANPTRLISNGQLDSPWGLQIAPASLGTLGGALLVGNFGNGRINAYDATSEAFEGALLGKNGKPLSITDLWALTVGNGAGGGDPNTLYFTADLEDEGHGLFGSLSPVALTGAPERSTSALMMLGVAGITLVRYRRACRADLAPATG